MASNQEDKAKLVTTPEEPKHDELPLVENLKNQKKTDTEGSPLIEKVGGVATSAEEKHNGKDTVSPEERAAVFKKHINIRQSNEFNPPEESYDVDLLTGDVVDRQRGRKLYFDDGVRRIDYILAWKSTKALKEGEEFDKDTSKHISMRKTFENNLEREGLELEYDIKEGREIQYLKVHSPWEVLTRYAEIMKTRMPIKEIPEEIRTTSIWEAITEYISVLFSPFALDPVRVPPIPKRFTYTYERGKDYLFAVPEDKELFFSHAQRSRITDYILRRKRYSDDPDSTFAFGIKRLLKNQIYTAAYPLHEGSWKPTSKSSMRKLLYENWAYWRIFYKVQPLDYVRIYFGEKIGLYFAWLGYYTYMLIFSSIVGVGVFLYGLLTVGSNIVAEESCDWNNNFTMCPKCDIRCPYWNYAAVCLHVQASHLFDNGATVFFAVFMSLWGTLFLELWKREQVGIQFRWNTMTFEEEEEDVRPSYIMSVKRSVFKRKHRITGEPPRPEYLIRLHNSKYRRKHKVTGQPPRPEYLERLIYSRYKKKHRVTGIMEPFLPFWRRKVPVYMASASTMIFLIAVAVACIIGVYVYRMAALMVFYRSEEEIVYKNASMVTAATAACINLVVIFVLSYVYTLVAHKLTDWECLRTQSEYDSSLTFKLYVLQFVNYYSSIFYIAFFKGRFTGRPGDYNTLLGARQEECSGGGCLMELCIQLAIIFVGKQLLQNTLMEIIIPRTKKFIKKCLGKDDKTDKKKLPWEKDYLLEELGQEGLFREYLEMMIQFGFVTIFVAAFPLAPLFALINNILEIRIDANKFITQMRRPLAIRAATIGVWYDVMFAVSRLAILTNAFLIAFTTGFVHRLVYVLGDSPDGSLRGYVDHTLSVFNVSDFAENNKPHDPEGRFNNVETCRYKDYRAPPGSEYEYSYTIEFWHVLAAQFIFIVTFENVVILSINFIAYVIPDMPRKLKTQVHRESYLTNEIILKTELEIAKGEDGVLSPAEMSGIRKRAKADIHSYSATPGEKDGDARTTDGVGDHLGEGFELEDIGSVNGPESVV